MTIDIYLDLKERSYRIYIGSGLLCELGSYMKKLSFGHRLLLITNPTIRSLYGNLIEKNLGKAGYVVAVGEVPDSEEAKSLVVAERLYDLAYLCGLDRQSPVVALGGGVVGDLAGFVAATYMRGIPFVQVPTTLLAQVDSSVGGKVAVNHPRGKNIIGAFYQPKLVLADIKVLSTLEIKELRAGLAEVIKYGVIAGAGFFNWLGENLDRLLNLDPDLLAHAVSVSCKIKASIVQEDETEKGRRAILNYGHTIGHAIEAITGYKTYRHGEAVAIGMVAEARLASLLGFISLEEVTRIESLVKRAGLPTKIPAQLSSEEMLSLMQKDKKALAGKYTFALPVKIGQVEVLRDIPGEVLKMILNQNKEI